MPGDTDQTARRKQKCQHMWSGILRRISLLIRAGGSASCSSPFRHLPYKPLRGAHLLALTFHGAGMLWQRLWWNGVKGPRHGRLLLRACVTMGTYLGARGFLHVLSIRMVSMPFTAVPPKPANAKAGLDAEHRTFPAVYGWPPPHLQGSSLCYQLPYTCRSGSGGGGGSVQGLSQCVW